MSQFLSWAVDTVYSTAAAVAETGRSVVGVNLSTRLDDAPTPAEGSAPLRLVRGDFYDVALGQDFDAVCYWDGFGIGTDADQRRMLKRVATDWLGEGGSAIIEVFNPFAWANSAGLVETKEPDAERGYQYRLGHRRDFDANQCRALDTWWVIDTDQKWTQSLRCYSPADLRLLVEGTGLQLESITAAGDPTSNRQVPDFGSSCWSYLATLRQA